MPENVGTKNNISPDLYSASAIGALTGGVGVKAAANMRSGSLARKVYTAFSQSDTARCDIFTKRHKWSMTKAAQSKKGFFGKITSMARELMQTENMPFEAAIDESTANVVKGYTQKSIDKLGVLADPSKVSKSAKKLLQKDIARSFKSSNRILAAAGIVAGAFIGILTACAVKEISKSTKKN